MKSNMRFVSPAKSGFRLRSLGVALEDSAARFPDKVGVILGSESFTYSDLRRRAREVGRGLLALGVDPGDRVAVWLPNSIEWLATALGVGMIGAVLVPVNLRYRQEEAEYILSQSGAKSSLRIQLCRSGTKGVPGATIGFGAESQRKSPLFSPTSGRKK